MSRSDVKARLITAAFEQFEVSGFEGCTVDDIVTRAGVGRTTFFRYFRTKEDVVFPDHESLLAEVADALQRPSLSGPLTAVIEGARLVLQYYIDEGDRARARFRLSSQVTALRDREIAVAHQYQRTFRAHLSRSVDDSLYGQIGAELQAAAVVAANNHIIRRWLRGETTDPHEEFDEATSRIAAMDWAGWTSDGTPPRQSTSFVVVETRQALDSLLPRLRAALSD